RGERVFDFVRQTAGQRGDLRVLLHEPLIHIGQGGRRGHCHRSAQFVSKGSHRRRRHSEPFAAEGKRGKGTSIACPKFTADDRIAYRGSSEDTQSGSGLAMEPWMWIAVVAVALACLAGVAFVIWRPIRNSWRAAQLAKARQDFHRHRERLEARFFELAAASGKPRGVRWVDCDFDDDVAYARDRHTGDLAALVAVTIRFEAIEGGPMEDVEAVGNLRAATAVFR